MASAADCLSMMETERLKFKEQRTMCFFPASSSKPIYLICSESVALIKSGKVNQDYEKQNKKTFQLMCLICRLELITTG